MSTTKKVAIAIASDGMGDGSDELRRLLIRNFLHALEAERKFPTTICLYADGVHLAAEGSPVLDHLRTLEALGTRILVCRTCASYYGIEERIAAGTIGTMADIVAALFEADSVIRP